MKNQLLTLAFSLTLAATATTAQAQLPAHLDAALQLVDGITVAQQAGAIYQPNTSPALAYNRYGGTWGTGSIATSGYKLATPSAPAENLTKCAPLVTHLLKNTYAWSWSKSAYKFVDPTLTPVANPDGSITNNLVTTASPYPYQYVALMKQKKGFPAGALANLNTVQPGYLFALWEPLAVKQDHDHAGLVVEVDLAGALAYPSSETTSDASLAGSRLVAVDIVDSTDTPHGATDSRIFTAGGTTYTIAGAGTATIGVLIDAAGNILGHTWSLPTANYATPVDWLADLHGRLQRQSVRELVFARHEKQPAQ